jgi:hypothetical protein
MALWTMCNTDCFESKNVGYSRYSGEVFQFSSDSFQGLVTQQHTIPLLIIFLLSLMFLSCYTLFEEVLIKGATEVLSSVFNLKLKGKSESINLYKSSVSNILKYSQAVKYGRFKSLASYNILHNPKYQAAFGVSSAWAARHQHMGRLNFIYIFFVFLF